VAITMGDPAGIGPEIILRTLQRPTPGVSRRVFGSREIFVRTAKRLGLNPKPPGVIWVDTSSSGDEADKVEPGVSGEREGALSVAALEKAMEVVVMGRADALITAPITKASARAAGFPFPGHTEFLAHRCGVADTAMMLAGPQLRVVPLTGHMPLHAVSECLDVGLVRDTLLLTVETLTRDLGVSRPRVALAGLNPHAGEDGMLGTEEQDLLAPGLALAAETLEKQEGRARLVGPLPADGIFVGPETWDAVVCCYHDQAMIPIKILHRDDAVNHTLGLPVVRTSPAHGSALDIADKGTARHESMAAAIKMAVEIVRRRQRAG